MLSKLHKNVFLLNQKPDIKLLIKNSCDEYKSDEANHLTVLVFFFFQLHRREAVCLPVSLKTITQSTPTVRIMWKVRTNIPVVTFQNSFLAMVLRYRRNWIYKDIHPMSTIAFAYSRKESIIKVHSLIWRLDDPVQRRTL